MNEIVQKTSPVTARRAPRITDGEQKQTTAVTDIFVSLASAKRHDHLYRQDPFFFFLSLRTKSYHLVSFFAFWTLPKWVEGKIKIDHDKPVRVK